MRAFLNHVKQVSQRKHSLILPIIVSKLLCVACQTPIPQSETRMAEDIHLRVAVMPQGLDRFNTAGPFQWSERSDTVLATSVDERREVDVYLTSAAGKAPVVIMSHGNFSGKQAHANQARRLASWGFHVIVLELPNRDQWLENGRRIFDLTMFVQRWPKFLGENVDGNKIILVGHSFGGSAVTLAAAQGAPAIGLILLDPAVVHPKVQQAMEKVRLPAVLLGADKKVFIARGRPQFRKRWAAEFMEFSVNGSTHDDAQGPSMFSRFTLGVDPFTDDRQRNLFTASLVSATLSLASSGNLSLLRRDIATATKSGDVSGIIYRNR